MRVEGGKNSIDRPRSTHFQEAVGFLCVMFLMQNLLESPRWLVSRPETLAGSEEYANALKILAKFRQARVRVGPRRALSA